MKVAAVIPARMQSVRLPGKPMRLIAGVPMILRVLERAQACPELQRIIVATDSEEIYRLVRDNGGEAWRTSPDHRTGSDRVAEVARQLTEDLVLNLQGDEPLLPPSTVRALIQFAETSARDLTVATPMVPLAHLGDIVNPNIVKVVGSQSGQALYFSRLPIPYRKSAPLDLQADPKARDFYKGYHKHVGIYLYRREFLLKYVTLSPTPLELSESLEQLRILEHGYPIYLVPVPEDSLSVDTQEDLELVQSLIARGQGASFVALMPAAQM
jgi:3-deoxy-manno-octulosonate cytidylyltransferase (CMP-KDO synthetase)